jgi:hypothetical protein
MVTRVLQAVESGDPRAADQLLPLVDEERRRVDPENLALMIGRRLATGPEQRVAPVLGQPLAARPVPGARGGEVIRMPEVGGLRHSNERLPASSIRAGVGGTTRSDSSVRFGWRPF